MTEQLHTHKNSAPPIPSTVTALRPEEMLAKPVFIDPAFDDPQQVLDLVHGSAPYRLSAAVHKTHETGKDVPWFRVFWARGEKVYDERANFIFHNERFIEAAKQSFNAQIIIPSSLMNNLNAPMSGGVPHLDLPHFRGASGFHFNLLVAMGYSGLFHAWAIPLASTLCWFYRGAGGDFDYWPDGPDGTRQTLSTPLWNKAVVSDNEYMFHRVGGVGRDEDHIAPGTISRSALLESGPGENWTIADGEDRRMVQAADMRLSILWKAYAFADEKALKVFREKTDELTLPQALSILSHELDRRGVGKLDIEAGYEDAENRRLIHTHFDAPPLNDAHRRQVN